MTLVMPTEVNYHLAVLQHRLCSITPFWVLRFALVTTVLVAVIVNTTGRDPALRILYALLVLLLSLAGVFPFLEYTAWQASVTLICPHRAHYISQAYFP